jgi:hypothetical protein
MPPRRFEPAARVRFTPARIGNAFVTLTPGGSPCVAR